MPNAAPRGNSLYIFETQIKTLEQQKVLTVLHKLTTDVKEF